MSGDSIRDSGARDELTLDQLKRDERYYAAGNPLVGEKTTHLRGPGQSGADTLIETVRFDGVTYHVPIIAAAGIVGSGGGGPSVSQFYTDDGKYKYTLQSDPVDGKPFGRIVIYETDVPFGGGVRAVGELTPTVY